MGWGVYVGICLMHKVSLLNSVSSGIRSIFQCQIWPAGRDLKIFKCRSG